jgi:hypothetical protein
MSRGDNKKNNKQKCDEACTDLKLRQKGSRKFYATNQVH